MENSLAEPDMVPLNGTSVVTSKVPPSNYEMTIAMADAKAIVEDRAPAPVPTAEQTETYDNTPEPGPVHAPRMGRF